MDYRSIFLKSVYSNEEQKEKFIEMLNSLKEIILSDKVTKEDTTTNLANLLIILRVLGLKYKISFGDIIKISDKNIDKLTEGRKIFD